MASLRDTKKLMDKHQSLKQDFDDLFRGTQDLKARLEEAKRKKSRLLAEVRFLRRRHKLLSSNSLAVNMKGSINRPQNLETPSGKKSYKEEDVASRRNHSLLDLNKVSEQVDCEEVQVEWEPLRSDKATKLGIIESDPLTNDLKLSICRGISKGIGSVDVAERTGKRKISWQDQVALRV